MAKKSQYYDTAQNLYVEEQKSVATISQQINVTQKTLHNWRKKGHWDEKRETFIASKTSCHSALYELLNTVIKQALEECKESGSVPDRDTLNFIKAMSDKLPKLKHIELEFGCEKKGEDAKEDSESLINAVNEYLMGR